MLLYFFAAKLHLVYEFIDWVALKRTVGLDFFFLPSSVAFEDVVGMLGLLQRLQETSAPRSRLIRSIHLQVAPIHIHLERLFQQGGDRFFIYHLQGTSVDWNQGRRLTQQQLYDVGGEHLS